MSDEPERLGLSDAIESVRSELQEAWARGQGQWVQFGIGQVSLTLTVVAGRSVGGSGKIRWWVVEAGAEGHLEREATQTLVLTLNPFLQDPKTGRRGPMQVTGNQEEPGG
ncbi:trypco2 family protein [Nocardia sp. AB354]|uniref:trypco2 family protein n=1 Tax=Nocardia sp. AB354 TaxID=3413283 RepID=UPI003C26541E